MSEWLPTIIVLTLVAACIAWSLVCIFVKGPIVPTEDEDAS